MAVMQPLRALRAARQAEAGGGAPPLSPERVALGLAISVHTEMQAERTASEAAMETASQSVRDAYRRLDAAPELLVEAKANAAVYLSGLALGEIRTPPQTIREARAAAVDAQDDLDAAKVARDALGDRVKRLDHEARELKRGVENAALVVMSAEMAGPALAMAGDLIRLQREMYATGQVLEWLTRVAKPLPVVETQGGMFSRVADDAIRQAINRLQTRPTEWDTHNNPRTLGDATEPLRAAFAALQTDPAAPLPTAAVAKV